MANNLDGDLKSLSSAWEGLRIRIADLIDGSAAFCHAVAHACGIKGGRRWRRAHPALTRQLLIAGGCIAGNDCNGWLVVGWLLVCLLARWAKLRLGFSLLTGSMNAVRVLPALWGMVTGSVLYWEALSGRCSVRLVLSWLRLPELPFLSGNTGIPSGHFCRGVQRDYGKADPVARNI
ncbi:tail protein [Shigella boydii]|uniref:Tail protein n=1 Tax=Shigella boydii TaxID=621 RepID=A0A2X2JCV5_SHIBO|nr:tail protein [Shigella boydii]